MHALDRIAEKRQRTSFDRLGTPINARFLCLTVLSTILGATAALARATLVFSARFLRGVLLPLAVSPSQTSLTRAFLPWQAVPGHTTVMSLYSPLTRIHQYSVKGNNCSTAGPLSSCIVPTDPCRQVATWQKYGNLTMSLSVMSNLRIVCIYIHWHNFTIIACAKYYSSNW